jgi:hypothetical protein
MEAWTAPTIVRALSFSLEVRGSHGAVNISSWIGVDRRVERTNHLHIIFLAERMKLMLKIVGAFFFLILFAGMTLTALNVITWA